LKFEHALKRSQPESTIVELDNNAWLDRNVTLLNQSAVVSSTKDPTGISLSYTNLYQYRTVNAEPIPANDKTASFVLKIENSFEQMPLITEQQAKTTLSSESEVNLKETSVQNRFIIERSQCWTFSRTIRVDLKPVCLLVNKTRYRIEMYERKLGADEDKRGLIHQVVEENGRASLSELASVKQYRFSICLDEYSVEERLNLANSSNFFLQISILKFI